VGISYFVGSGRIINAVPGNPENKFKHIINISQLITGLTYLWILSMPVR
jgi:hypothetical protein